MNIALVGPSPVPFAIGGIENLHLGIYNFINKNTNHNCEMIKIPSREDNFWNIINSYRKFWEMDLTHFDMVISTKYPCWMVNHNNHVCYLAHRLRGLYDTYHFTKQPVEFNHNDDLVKEILEFLDSTYNSPDLCRFFDLMDRLYERRGQFNNDIFGFPHPFIRKLVHYMDNAALSNGHIKKFYSISRTVKNRTEYFPVGTVPEVIYPPSHLENFICGSYDYLFTVSRLDGPKRVAMMIEAMKFVDSDIKLLIAGKGPDEVYLKNLATNDERIKFIGFVNDDELISYYSNALAVLYIPYEEDYGLVTIEAMMSKKPVITCSDSGGTNEFVKHISTGLVAKPDPSSLAEQINYLCKNKNQAPIMGENGYNLVNGITWPATISRLIGDPLKNPVSKQKSNYRHKMTVTSHFPIYPPKGGGQLRIYNIYKQVSKTMDVEIVCMGGSDSNAYTRKICDGLTETVIPKTIIQAEKEWEYEKEVGIPVSDSALPLVSHLTPEYGDRLNKAINGSDFVVLSHPYLLHEIEKVRGNRPLIYEAHNVEYLLKKSSYKNNNKKTNEILDLIYKIENEACQKSDLIMTCSEEDKNTLVELYNADSNKIIVVPNGVDCEEINFTKLDQRYIIKQKIGIERERLAIFIGSWHPPNIEACEHIFRIASECPDISFLILGSVCLALNNRTIPQNVGLMGIVSDEEKNLILSAADIALNPILSGSGTNLKMFEYMAAGIPIVTTEFGSRGIKEEAQCFYKTTIEEMGKTIVSVFNKENSEIITAARREVERNYDWKNISNVFVKSLNKMMEK